MKFKKIIAAITATVCSASMLVTSAVLSNAEEDKTVKIMSIGDSITDGYGVNGSYRKFLYNNLTNDGYSIDMVGPEWSWGDDSYSDSATGESFTYDAAHCGYSGYAIKEYSGRSGILEKIQSGNFLATYTPDIVILQIGTNDVIDNYNIDTAGERLEVLADYILQNISSDSALFITTIPNLDPNRGDVYSWFGNYRHSADWQTNYSDEEAEKWVQEQVDNYNSQVKALVEEKQQNGVSNIYFGNVNSAITDVTTQLGDGVHPNNTGYKLMGDYWTPIIEAYLSGETTEPSTESTDPTEESTEPSTESTDPTEESTEPSTESTDPTEESTEPSTESTDPTEESTEPSTESTDPTEESTEASEPNPEHLWGDINQDNNVTVLDAVVLSKILTGAQQPDIENSDWLEIYDLNTDEKINVFDLVALKVRLMKYR